MKNITIIGILSIFVLVLSTSCHKKDYPCPGLGQNNEADISMFDENGKLKEDVNKNSRVNKTDGLMRKSKNEKRLKKMGPKAKKRT